jgi:hypothetical protein
MNCISKILEAGFVCYLQSIDTLFIELCLIAILMYTFGIKSTNKK